MHWQQLEGRTVISLCPVHSFNAVSQVNRTADTQHELTVYIATEKAFSLFKFTVFSEFSHLLDEELLAYANPVAKSEIVHLQCHLGPNKDRTGVVVRPGNEYIELWDYRQPRKPAVMC